MAEAPKIPHFLRERLRAQQAGFRSGGEHPDADLLAAFGENTLARGERSLVMNHLAVCEACRDVLMLSQAPPDEAAKPVRSPASPLLGWMSLRWGSLAVVFVLTIGVVLMNRGSWQQASRPAPPPSSAIPAANVAAAPAGDEERKRFESDNVALSGANGKAAGTKARGRIMTERFEPSSDAPARYAGTQANRIGRPFAGEAQESKITTSARRAGVAKKEDSYRANSAGSHLAIAENATVEAPAAPAAGAGFGTIGRLSVSSVQKSKPSAPQQAKADSRGAEASPGAGSVSETVVASTRQDSGFYDALGQQEPSKKKTAPEDTPSAAAQPASRQPVLARDDKNAVAQSLNATPSANFSFETKDKDQVEGLTISKETLATASPTPMKWRIRAGKLQQSTDGKTWQEVNLEPGVNLHSFWIQGTSVWAGGTGGSLFHVSEQGKNAVRVPIKVSGGGDVSQTVVTVSFSDELHGIITLENGHILRTADGGKTWERL